MVANRPGLVHLAAARVGRADSGGRLHEVRRSAADAGARRARRLGVRYLRRRRLVRAADRGVPAGGPRLPVLRRHVRSSASGTFSTSGSTRDRATRRCCRSGRRSPGRPTCISKAAISTADGSKARCSSASARAAGRRTGRCSRTASSSTKTAARCPSRWATPSSRRTSSSRAAPTCSGCGSRASTTARRCGSARRSSRASSRRTARSATRCGIWWRTCTTSIRPPMPSRSPRMEEVDRYILARYGELARRIVAAYDAYDYPTIFQAVNSFTTVDLSALYNDISKDRLYTFGARSRERRSAQTAMYVMADGLTRLLAPLVPVTADQLWASVPSRKEASVHIARFPDSGELLAAGGFGARPAMESADRGARAGARRDRAAAQGQADRQLAAGEGGRRRRRTPCSRCCERHAADLPMLFIVSERRAACRARRANAPR